MSYSLIMGNTYFLTHVHENLFLCKICDNIMFFTCCSVSLALGAVGLSALSPGHTYLLFLSPNTCLVLHLSLPTITTPCAQVTHSRNERRFSHGYDLASFVAICTGP